MTKAMAPNNNDEQTNQNADPSGLEQAFSAALRAAGASPENQDAWDHLEELADKLQRPDEAAELYRAVLERNLPASIFTPTAQRAVHFHEEWFGDSPDKVTRLLSRITELDSQAEWAFERLTMLLASASQWDELLGLYDRALVTEKDDSRRKQLLTDAAQAAKDFAEQPDRAANYLQQLLVLDSDNATLRTSLERLLERQDRWADLVELWATHLASQSPEQGIQTRLRMATCWREQLGEPQRALDTLEELLADSPENKEACEQLERLLDHDATPLAPRMQALSLLRDCYTAAERPESIVAVLNKAILFVEADERAPLRRELAGYLAELGQDEPALEQYRALLISDPTDPDARQHLRALAERTGKHEVLAAALLAAAEATTSNPQRAVVMMEVAQLRQSSLDDVDGAIVLYSQVLENEEAERSVALGAAHRLSDLLAQSERLGERLAVLEKLARLESSLAVRRHVLGDAARLAEQLGEPDRALANWQPLLDEDAHDLEALSAVSGLLETHERWPELLQMLQQRADAKVLPLQRRADLVHIANLLAGKLEEPDEAIVRWLQIAEEFGHDDTTIGALDALLTQTGRHRQLAEIIQHIATAQRARIAPLMVRLGDILATELEEPAEALSCYQNALQSAPQDAGAQAGLGTLLADPDCAKSASEALAHACKANDDWRGLLALLEVRLENASEGRSKAVLLREAAQLFLERGDEPGRAFEQLAAALPATPNDLEIEEKLLELAEGTGRFQEAVDSLTAAAEATPEAGARRGYLLRTAATLLEEKLADCAAAWRSYQAASVILSEDPSLFEAIARCAARADNWGEAVGATISAVRLRDGVRPSTLEALQSGVSDANQYEGLAKAMESALAAAPLPETLAHQLELTVARWWRDGAQNLEAAAAAAQRAVLVSSDNRTALKLLAALQRELPGSDLLGTLRALDSLQPHCLDPLYEAANLTDQQPESARQAHRLLEALYRKASGLWRAGQRASGTHQPADVASWALDRLVNQLIVSGNGAGASQVLMDASGLALEADQARTLRLRAAAMLAEGGQRGRAIELYRSLLSEHPDDAELLEITAGLCEAEGRLAETLTLRQQLLECTEEPAKKIALRLAQAALSATLDASAGQVTSLRSNLAECPGDAATLEALSKLLSERGKHGELFEVLTEQARQLESTQPGQAAKLWTQAAKLAEAELDDSERATMAYTEVVNHGDDGEALDALARLHAARGQWDAAARWLQRRLGSAAQAERVAIRIKLARAQLKAERTDAAIATLHDAFQEAPRNAEVRKLLLKQYRIRQDWPALAATLTKAALEVRDETVVLTYAREAGELYQQRLDEPAESVPALERASDLAPDDRGLKLMLTDGLRAAGRLDEARQLLETLIEEFGRRRSTERAQAHLKLAQVAQAQEQTGEAIEQLEIASKMDANNKLILVTLASHARKAGELDRAERAYRTLLMSVRRENREERVGLGPAGVLFELSRIAADREHADKATELMESVLEAFSQDDTEAASVQGQLRAREEYDLLRHVLEHRLQHVSSPHRRAAIYGDLGQLLSEHLDDQAGALEARLEAIRVDPGSPEQQQAAWDLASSAGEMHRYVAVVESLLADERADKSAHVRCELLLRLGEVLEKEREDLARAAELYAQAAATQVRRVDVWRAQARVASLQGDTELQVAILAQLANLGEDEAEPRADALYRLAEVQLASVETLSDGTLTLAKALKDSFRAERAALILAVATQQHPDNQQLLETYERVARRSDDPKTLLLSLERLANHASGSVAQAREAVALAERLDDQARAEALMIRAADIGRSQDTEEALQSIDWALLGLAQLRAKAGDLAGAVKWLGEAAEVAELQPLFAASEMVALLAAGSHGDLTLAAKVYESLLERAPTSKRAWGPLAEIYAKLDDVEHLQQLVDEHLDGLEDVSDRNALRLALAQTLLRKGDDVEDALELLRAVLSASPDDAEAQALLFDHLEQTGRHDELMSALHDRLERASEQGQVDAIVATSLQLASRLREEKPSDAREVLEHARKWNSSHEEVVSELLQLLDPEQEQDQALRSELLGVLVSTLPPARAAERALELAALHDQLDEGGAALAALKRGAERAPEHEDLQAELLRRCRAEGDHAGLIQCLLSAADSASDEKDKALLLREAATVQRDALHDPAAAAQLLRHALELDQDDDALRIELAHALSSAGSTDEGLAILGERLESAEPEPRLALLRARTALHKAAGDDSSALEDLRRGYEIDPTHVAPELETALLQRISVANMSRDEATARDSTLMCVDVMLVQGKREEATELLKRWTDAHADDIDPLRLLRAILREDDNWKGVAACCESLLRLQEGEERIESALQLANAQRELGEPLAAREGLEHVRSRDPNATAVRAQLRQLYEQLDDQLALAKLLLDDAQVLESDSERASMLARAGRLLVELGQADDALPPLQSALELTPAEPSVIISLADAYILGKNYDAATELLEQSIVARKGRRTPEICVFHHRKAQIARARYDMQAEFAHLQEAHLANKKNGLVAAELADLAEELQQWEFAAKILRTITLIDTPCPISRAQAFVRQGRIALRQGDDKAARMWARRAEREDAECPELARYLEELGERSSGLPPRMS